MNVSAFIALGSVYSVHAYAQSTDLGSKNTEWTQGDMQSSDRGPMTVLVRHGEIKNLDIGKGTTRFKIADAEIFNSMRIGEKFSFRAEKQNGQYTIVKLERR